MRLRLAAAVLLFALAACSGQGEESVDEVLGPAGGTAAPAQSLPPKCADVFVVGKPITIADVEGTCTDPDGGIVVSGSHRCADGRRLFAISATSGAPEGWGFSGGVYTATRDAAADPAYRRAYEQCMG